MEEVNEIRTLLRRWGRAVNRLNEIKKLLKAINEELDEVADIRPQQLTGMPHGTNVGRPTEENAFRRMAKEKNRISDLEKEQHHCVEIIKDTEWALSFLEDRDRKLLRLHYVDGLSMETVAEYMHFNTRWAWRLERRGILRLATVIGHAKSHSNQSNSSII